MDWLNKILGREQTLDQMIKEQQELGRKIDELRDRRKLIAARVNAELAARTQGLPAGVIAKGD